MPNWCANRLIASGPYEDIHTLVSLVTGPSSAFDFDRILPMPKELQGSTSPAPADQAQRLSALTGFPSWYAWRCARWGTKGAAAYAFVLWSPKSPAERLAEVVEEGSLQDSAEWSFDTAWSPPIPVVRELTRRFPRVEFTHDFIEEGADLSGHFVWGGDPERPKQRIYGGEDIYSLFAWHERFRPDPEEELEDGEE